MKKKIPLASPNIRKNHILKLNKVLRSGNLVQGKNVSFFERLIEKKFKIKYCIAVSSGTASLHLILMSLGIRPGDEIIIPAYSYIATANVIELVGAKPIFVDIDINTFNIDPKLIQEKISNKTKAIMIVHEFGLTAEIDLIKKICKKNKLLLIEDAACAIGAKEKNEYAGTFGISGSYSFHPRKIITSGEGGAVVTNNYRIAKKIRSLRDHGSVNLKRKKEYNYAGLNYRMTDIQACLLIEQFKMLDTIINQRTKIATYYLKNIKKEKIVLPEIKKNKIQNWQTFHIILKNNLNQKKIINNLKKKGIESNIGAQCIPTQNFYASKYTLNVKKDFPEALKAYRNGLAIPLHEKLKWTDIEYIVKQLNNIQSK